MVNKAEKTPAELADHLAPRIKRAIKESGKTYEQIGEAVGVSKTAVSKWTKSGQIFLSNLWSLANATGKPMAWFFPGFDDDKDPAANDGEAESMRQLLSDAAAGGSSEVLDDLLIEILEAKRELRRL